jgi:drug/metabolite transporter (DMT)-like permease
MERVGLPCVRRPRIQLRRGLRHVPASRAGIFTVCLPVSAAAVGVAWLGEPFGAAHAVAFALSLAGLLLATWPDQAPAASSSSSS